MQPKNFAIHHHVDRSREIQINALRRGARGEAMLDVRAGEKARKRPEKTEPPNGTPADIFDLAVGGIGLRRDHHFPAGEFAVAESEEKARAAIPIRGVANPVRKSGVIKARETS